MRNIKRTFIIGEEWLYYKIYCGNYSADVILIETINPILIELKNRDLIDYWFFIRYSDPKNHLRLRFHLNRVEVISEVIQIMTLHFGKLMKEETAYEINIGTYKREIERYGINTIIEAEKIFYFQSRKAIQIISETPEQDSEIIRILVALKNIDDLLESFKIPLTERQYFAEQQYINFKLEYQIKNENTKKIGELYLRYKADIFLLLNRKEEPKYLKGLFKSLDFSYEEEVVIKKIRSKINNNNNITPINLINSFVHMNVNRLFRSKQGQYEMLCYYFITKYYKTLIAKK